MENKTIKTAVATMVMTGIIAGGVVAAKEIIETENTDSVEITQVEKPEGRRGSRD